MLTYKLMDYQEKQAHYYEQPRKEMLSFLPKNFSKVLDVGCSNGLFGKEIKKKKKKIEVWGVEPSKASGKIAKKNLDKAFIGTLDECYDKLPDNYFDVIYFNDVLEHILDPYETLSLIKKKLSKDGVIIASIPNVRFIRNLKKLMINKDWEYEDEGILDRTHLRFFTEKSIKRMFEACDYEIVELKGINKSKTLPKRIFNIATLGIFNDTMFLQYGIVAKPN